MRAILVAAFVACALAQQVGTNKPENHPALSVSQCTKSGTCKAQSKSIVLDSNWRWVHRVNDYTNCYSGNTWDTSICPDDVTCAKNCALEGGDYQATYGITTSGDKVSLKFVTNSNGKNIGSRVYLLDSESQYKVFKLKNQEFTFTVDVSQLPCGLNGALYFVEMPANGSMGVGNNHAGAKYGTGYCDAQCPHDLKFIAGEANAEEWKPSSEDPNSGEGRYGACCGEMDIWEANSVSTAYTAHDCSTRGLYRCEGLDCGNLGDDRYKGVCDKDGCDFNSYRLGVTDFYGQGQKLDTKKPVTVVTQFVTSDGTDSGDLVEIRRLWKQNNVVIQNSVVSIDSKNYDSLTDNFCTKQKDLFGDVQDFSKKGGMKGHGAMLGRGVVLVISLWDDHYAHMLWLDSSYPTDKDPSAPGITRGSCATTSGVPSEVESQSANAVVTFSDIRFGPIGSTY